VRTRHGLWSALRRHGRARAEDRPSRERAQALLDYVGIGRRADWCADALSYGHQRRLEIARALAKIHGDGHAILLIEHDDPMPLRGDVPRDGFGRNRPSALLPS
jgi:branched-chain amino acid transport system ATP-binding protein